MKLSNNKQYLLQLVLIFQTVAVLYYTIIAIQNDGINVPLRAQEFLASMKWLGQFTLDFSAYLLLSAFWIMWRNKFSLAAIGIGLAASILGIILFAPYVLYLMYKENYDIKKVLIGER